MSRVAADPLLKLGPPPAGKLYHGVYPGGLTGEEDDLTLTDVQAYEAKVGKKAAWVYFWNNWYRSRAFPLATATWIRDHGTTMRVQDIPALAATFQARLGAAASILQLDPVPVPP